MPSLVELTVVGVVDSVTFDSSCAAEQLQRLHIANHLYLPLEFSSSFSRFAPRLTHLRISNVNGSSDALGLKVDIPRAIALWNNRESPMDRDQQWLANLQQVVIGRRPAQIIFYCGTAAQDYWMTTQFFRAQTDQDTSGRLVILPLPEIPDFNGKRGPNRTKLFEEAWQHWLDRNAGGTGCWDDGSRMV